MTAEIYVVAIDKGGSGKTTTAVNVATGLHRRGKRVLLMDLDPQGDTTRHLGFEPDELKQTINIVFTKAGTKASEVIMTTDFGMHFIPANSALDETDRSMTATLVGILIPFIKQIENAYDYIVIDTRRAGSLLTISALVVGTEVLIPLEAEYLAMRNLEPTMKDVNNVRNGLNPGLQIFGILFTKVRGNTRLAKDIMKDVGENSAYAEYVLPVMISNTIKYAEASYAGRPIQLYNMETAKEYEQLVELIIDEQQ